MIRVTKKLLIQAFVSYLFSWKNRKSNTWLNSQIVGRSLGAHNSALTAYSSILTFVSQSVCNTVLSVYWLITFCFFCFFLHEVMVQKYSKSFLRKILILPKMGVNGAFLIFSLNMVIRFFWNYAWWEALTLLVPISQSG